MLFNINFLRYALIHSKYTGKEARKELIHIVQREKSPCLQGKNPAPWIFPRATIYTKTGEILGFIEKSL
ncbi:phosphoenolpyruvate carboxykinase [Bacillus sp. SG-1]|nr:phosphoenolpyruvate carboxykinase [Bacillus sp. SG-1]